MRRPEDKNIVSTTPAKPDEYKGYKLSSLPRYLSFKAAIAHNEIVLKNTLVAVLILWGVQFSIDRYHDMEFAKEYRKKEFLLAPSEISGITPVKPHLVPSSYIDDISSIYLSLLGNVNAQNIEDNYAQLQKHMSDSLRIKFNAEISNWIDTVKAENISEVLKVTHKRYSDPKNGIYRISAIANRERYTGNNYVGLVREKIELVLRIVAPTTQRRWFLEIDSLQRGKVK